MSAGERNIGLGRRLGRAALWPFVRPLDSRFGGIARQLDAVHQDLVGRNDALIRSADAATEARLAEHGLTLDALEELRRLVNVDMDAATEAATVIGMTLSEVAESVGHLREKLEDRELVGSGLAQLHQPAADLLNYAGGHQGFAAQKGLWFNPPVVLEHLAGDVKVGAMNERIVEIPYVLRAMQTVPEGGRVLDVGANESTLAASLASLGYRVTALDLTLYPLEHPLLERVVSPVEEWQTEDRFDAVICLSTLEHIGVGAYEAPQKEWADQAAVARMGELLTKEGLLVLTTPFGSRAETRETERVYDRPALERLFDGWSIVDLTIAVHQEEELVWRRFGDDRLPHGARAVALLTARPAN